MEGALTARDRVGIQDFVLLDETTDAAFLSNLKKRFSRDLIYTYIGTLLVSVNPYKELDIYNKKQMETYMGINFFELPPHIYALADNAYQTMLTEFDNHFILISGESGAGKTEASKKILQYYAVSCPSTTLLNTVRDKMLMSNPVLEAFGNAKTLKNDNSSRFGKYMDIQFDSQGDAVGGHILNYLLEKSRVVHQNHGERNFHIFYQLVEGGEDDLLHQLGLERDAQHYNYLTQGECAIVSSINDRNDWKTVKNALLSSPHGFFHSVQHLFGIVSSVLHLGNIRFESNSKGQAVLANNDELRWLLGVDARSLQEGLTYRKIEVLSPFTVDHAIYARDALAKAIYGQTFTWLVNRINESMENKDPSRKTVIGLLDIYGFEVFYVNSFEQFCINYCNEKLQQLFIQLTLASEQEEYEAEGIEVIPNHIHTGDEECLRPGDATDLTFLERLEDKMGNHPHFVTHKLADKMTRKTLERGDFRLLHYAGEVTYCVVGFLDKNNDLLYRNIKDLICQSKNAIVKECFSTMDADSRRRPETVATQFKSSLLKLTEILMAKEAWYIRCLKSNESKQPGQFDEALIRHQVKYLGLMEHLRVRRAGFAYRRKFDVFLKRYKPLCPATWPHWRGEPADGVEVLVQHLGYLPNEYKMGRTKIFIRHPRTLYATEDAFEKCKHELATKIETCWRGVHQEVRWKSDVITQLLSCVTCPLIRYFMIDCRFIKGYMNRGQAKSSDNSEYLAFVRQNYLNRLKNHLPKTVLDKTSWLPPPAVLTEVRHLLSVTIQLKLVTSNIFKGKKESYPQSVAQPFMDTRITSNQTHKPTVFHSVFLQYSVPVIKYDRNGFKPRPRQLVLTQTAAYVIEEAKIKQRVLYTSLKGISVSNLTDGIIVFHITCEDPKQKGDLVMQCDHLFEFLTKLCVIANKQNAVKVVQGSIKIEIQAGKESAVDFSTGHEPMVYKAKNGHLMVVRRVSTLENMDELVS
uniref:Myosin IH n=1 Tax=Sparus aurata TaxID=8175 RepID=A0A671YBY2_SPAAU